jgi:S-adenosylmethionine:tRNA-ribosyltransferase-isomerase (queuine synthetase)
MKKISFILLFFSISLCVGVYYFTKREQKRIQSQKIEKEFDSIVRSNEMIFEKIKIETKRIQDSIRIEQIKLLK